MNALESELDTTTHVKCLSDAIHREDTISLEAWEALTVLSSFWINSSDGSTSSIILSSKYLHQMRCFFLNMFPIRQLRNFKNEEDGEIWDLSTATSQSTHLFQLFKVIIQSVYNSKDEMSQTKFDVFRSILVPLIQACIRRDTFFQNHIPSTNELLSDAMLEFVFDTSSEQSHHRLVVLMEVLVHLHSIKHWNRIQNKIQQMIDDAFQSNHDRDIVIAMTTSLSQVFAHLHPNVCNTNGSISRDAWMFIALTLYETSSNTTQLFESLDKVMWQAIGSLSQRESHEFVTMLSTIKSQSNDGSTISQWTLINIVLMCHASYGLDKCNITVQSGGPTTLLEEFIVDPILQDDDFKLDVDINLKELFHCCTWNDFKFSLGEDEIQYGDVLRFMNKVSNVLRQCTCPIKNNQKYTWDHKHIYVDLLHRTLNTPSAMKNYRVQFAIISMSVTIFMDFIDLKKNVLSIFLDVVQRCTSIKKDISHEFAGHMVVLLSRLSSDQEDNDHTWFTSTLIQIAKRSMIAPSNRTVLQFVLNALSFSNHGRLWISDHVVTELDSCSAERRCYGLVGLEALIGLCSYPQLLADIHVIGGVKSACEIIQSHDDDLKLELSTSQLDPWMKERLLNATLLSLIQYFCGETHPNYGCHNFVFAPESDGLKLARLIESTLILLPQDLRVYVVGNQDISSETPYSLSIALSCLRGVMNFLREKQGLSSFRSSDLRNSSFSPGYESISNHENNVWAAKMSEFSIDFESPFRSLPTIVTQAPISLNRKRFTPIMRLSLCYTLVGEFLKWKTELVECISSIELSHQVNLLLGATGSHLDLSQVKYFNLKDSFDLKRICMIWKLVIDSLNVFQVDKVSSCIDRKEYLSNLFPAIQLICSHQTHILQCKKHSTSEARDLFQYIRHVYMYMFSKTACCGVDFADEDKFVRDFKSIILDQLLIILSQLKGDVGLDSKLDLSFYATFLSDLGQDLKKSCDGQNGGVTKSLLRSYVALIEGLLFHIENILNHVELQTSSWNVIIKLNIVSLFCVDILFLCPIPKSIFKSLGQIGIYQLPTLVRNTKLALLKKRVRCPETQKSGILDPILVVSTLRKCMERTDSDNNYVWLSTFCAESIGRLWAESSNIKDCLEVQSVFSLVEFQDGLLLDYYLEQHSWYQTLLHSLYSCIEESCSVQLSPLLNALSTSSARIFGALKKNVNHITRSCWQLHEQVISNVDSLAFFESYLTVSTWILFVNQAKQASPTQILQGVQNSDQMKKNKALIANFHAHLRKLLVSMNEYESDPLVEALSIVNTKIHGSDQMNFANELIAYFDRNGIKPVKSNRRTLSSKGGLSAPTRKCSRSVKRSRNQLIDEWLEADHETQDDFEDLEDFLLPG